MGDATQLLNEVRDGNPEAAERLMALLYNELRHMAAAKMARENPGHTLQATALVHEAWLRISGTDGQLNFQNRAHFFGAAAEAMRRILVDAARKKNSAKHGGELVRVDWTELDMATASDNETVIAVSEALEKLAARDKISAELIKLRFFAGLPNVEAAQVLGLPERTAKRTWAYARAWMLEELRKNS